MIFETSAIFSTDRDIDYDIALTNPNYEIKNSQINFDSRLPLSKIEEIKEEIVSVKKLKKNHFQNIGQILFVKIIKRFKKIKKISYSLSTGFIITKNNKKNIITTLHTFTSDSKIKKINYNTSFIFFIRSEYNINDDISKFITNLNFFLKKSKNDIKIKKIKQIITKKIVNFLKNKKGYFGELFFNEDFLFLRKKLLKFMFYNKYEEKLKDIFYNHQPKPSIDICILEISENLENILKLKKIEGLKIKKEKQNKLYNYNLEKYIKGKKNRNDFSFLISYQDSIKNSIYEIEFESKKKLVNSKKKLKKFPICYFLNNNLSISYIKIWKENNYLINFEGSTTSGSSGGPIFDTDGIVIGINFGYYIFGDDKKNKNGFKNFEIQKDTEIVKIEENFGIKKENRFIHNLRCDNKFKSDMEFDLDIKKEENLNHVNTFSENISYGEIEKKSNFSKISSSTNFSKKKNSLSSLINFDINCSINNDKKKFDNVGIGLNLGISIFHPCLRIFFEFYSFEQYEKKIYKKKGKSIKDLKKSLKKNKENNERKLKNLNKSKKNKVFSHNLTINKIKKNKKGIYHEFEKIILTQNMYDLKKKKKNLYMLLEEIDY